MKDNNVIDKLENLKKIREEKNITQLKLSLHLDVSQELISRYERGSSFPQPNTLIKLANYFNCSVDYLLGLTDVTTPIKYLSLNFDDAKYSDLFNKYKDLSIEDQYSLEKYLDFLFQSK